jgi:hypothetical protein
MSASIRREPYECNFSARHRKSVRALTFARSGRIPEERIAGTSLSMKVLERGSPKYPLRHIGFERRPKFARG